MDNKQFSIFLTHLIPQILEHIHQSNSMSEKQLINEFYQSDFYSRLATPSSQLWQLSPQFLAQMYQEEHQSPQNPQEVA